MPFDYINPGDEDAYFYPDWEEPDPDWESEGDYTDSWQQRDEIIDRYLYKLNRYQPRGDGS